MTAAVFVVEPITVDRVSFFILWQLFFYNRISLYKSMMLLSLRLYLSAIVEQTFFLRSFRYHWQSRIFSLFKFLHSHVGGSPSWFLDSYFYWRSLGMSLLTNGPSDCYDDYECHWYHYAQNDPHCFILAGTWLVTEITHAALTLAVRIVLAYFSNVFILFLHYNN